MAASVCLAVCLLPRNRSSRLIKGLDPQAQAVDAQVAPDRNLLGGKVVGIGLEGDLTVGGKREMPPQVFHKLSNLSLTEPRRRAAADKEGVKYGELVAVKPGFLVQRCQE